MSAPLDREQIAAALRERGYIAGERLSLALQLVLAMHKPLLIEGPAGVGKTESAKALADCLGTELIRMQCYEGLDAATALYEWNYPHQMLRIRLTESSDQSIAEREAQIFSREFLLERPLLQAITRDRSPVLLIDEIDRADEAFEAFLLELLAEFQITIPEIGTVKGVHLPYVILTSNRSRELSDALRRRCLYLWQEYPTREQELAILRARIPEIPARLAQQITGVMAVLRELPLTKIPGVAESLDWATALIALHRTELDAATVEETLGCVIKLFDDQRVFSEGRASWEPAIDEAPPAIEDGGYALRTDFGIGTVTARP